MLFMPLGPDQAWCASGNALTYALRVFPLGGTPFSVNVKLDGRGRSFLKHKLEISSAICSALQRPGEEGT